jgi:hypothetical protein
MAAQPTEVMAAQPTEFTRMLQHNLNADGFYTYISLQYKFITIQTWGSRDF